MQDPEIYSKIGELTGRFNTFEATMTKEFLEVKQAIKEQSVVPYGIYEARLEATDIIHKDHSDSLKSLNSRVDRLEDINNIRKNTITGKLAEFFDSAIVKLLGSAIITGVLIGMYLNYKVQIDSISEKVDNVSKQDQIIEQKN